MRASSRPRLFSSSALLAVALALPWATPSTAQFLANCPFSVDAVTGSDAARDGLLLVRHARGLRDAALVTGTNATATAVDTNIRANSVRLDVNGNGRFDVDDAQTIARVLLGFRGDAQLSPIVGFGGGQGNAGSGAVRSTAAAISAYLEGGCATTFSVSKTALQTKVGPAGANRATNVQAIRFLTQSTFGASLAQAEALNARTGGTFKAKATAWVDEQFNLPLQPTNYDYILARAALPGQFGNEVTREAWWKQALTGPDQLRVRLALALSEIAVVSSNGNSSNSYELAGYMDMLQARSFTNFRDVLSGVVRSPAMGRYLDHIRNDGASTNPNENFAREVLQLFSVGLTKLNADGSNQAGDPPSYTEDIVKGFANAFTGMAFDDLRTPADRCPELPTETLPSWFWQPDRTCTTAGSELKATDLQGWRRPMRMFDNRYSNRQKPLLDYTAAEALSADARCSATAIIANRVLPAIAAEAGFTGGTRVSAATGNAMVERAIDNIFCHPTVGPFIGKSLIKFFVTSTPTPGYVSRVTAAFNNNGGGVRGDMKAVMRAILLDDEALTPATVLSATDLSKFGKLKEPILRVSQTIRAFNGYAASGKYKLHNINSPEFGISQNVLQSPSVFNFFHPEFAPPGPIAMASANAPEFEITTTTSIAGTANFLGTMVAATGPRDGLRQHGYLRASGNCNPFSTPTVREDCIVIDYSDLYAILDDAPLMFDYLNVVLMGGSLPQAARDQFAAAIDAAYPNTTGACVLPASPTIATQTQLDNFDDCRRSRVKGAVWLAMHAPEFQIQQ
jgi:uncharacterized protein (DUF1800 family)